MNTFEKPTSEPILDAEELKTELSELLAEQARLEALIIETKENIDVELGSEDYIDHGYTARLREEIEPRIKKIEDELREMSDQGASQRNLNL